MAYKAFRAVVPYLVDPSELDPARPLYLYGCGAVGRYLAACLRSSGIEVTGFITTTGDGQHEDIEVIGLTEYLSRAGTDDQIIIASSDEFEIQTMLADQGIHGAKTGLPLYHHLSGTTSDEHRAMRRFLESHARRNGVALDVRANRGQVSLMLLRLGLCVVAFEPDPDMRAILTSALGGRDDIEILPFAVGDRTGSATFYVDPRGDYGGSSLVPNHIPLGRLDRIGAGTVVSTITLDEFCGQRALAPAVIKIDAEGVEPNVMSGAARVIQQHRPLIIFEVLAHRWPFGLSEMATSLAQHYRLVCLEEPERDVIGYYDSYVHDPEQVEYSNIGCVPR